MREQILKITRDALSRLYEPRFYSTERGYQGRLYCALQDLLLRVGIVDGRTILELEYQKGARHATRQRPDIILHVPTEHSGALVHENNVAVWALKRSADANAAHEDFGKLNEMFERLDYDIGIFVNLEAQRHFVEEYRGNYPSRLFGIAVRRLPQEVHLIESAGWPPGAA